MNNNYQSFTERMDEGKAAAMALRNRGVSIASVAVAADLKRRAAGRLVRDNEYWADLGAIGRWIETNRRAWQSSRDLIVSDFRAACNFNLTVDDLAFIDSNGGL